MHLHTFHQNLPHSKVPIIVGQTERQALVENAISITWVHDMKFLMEIFEKIV
jgi:hypothetical protein